MHISRTRFLFIAALVVISVVLFGVIGASPLWTYLRNSVVAWRYARALTSGDVESRLQFARVAAAEDIRILMRVAIDVCSSECEYNTSTCAPFEIITEAIVACENLSVVLPELRRRMAEDSDAACLWAIIFTNELGRDGVACGDLLVDCALNRRSKTRMYALSTLDNLISILKEEHGELTVAQVAARLGVEESELRRTAEKSTTDDADTTWFRWQLRWALDLDDESSSDSDEEPNE